MLLSRTRAFDRTGFHGFVAGTTKGYEVAEDIG
jgi:hypothetical protein